MTTKLMTIDEAQAAVVSSAFDIIEHAHTSQPFEISAMLWGAGNHDGLDPHDRALTRRHRRTLDDIIDLGYAGIIVDQLDGIASASTLDRGGFERFARPAV